MFLNCHTYFSMRFGTLSPEKLVTMAKENGCTKIALTDINNASCALDFIKLCYVHEIEPVIGLEFRHEGELLWIGLAENNQGFMALNQYYSDCSLNNTPLPKYAPTLPNTFIIYPFSYDYRRQLEEWEFVGIRPREISKIYSSPIRYMHSKAVVLHPVTLANKTEHKLHCILRAIDQNTLLHKLEKKNGALPEDSFVSESKLVNHFADYPKIIENTRRILNSCEITLDLKSAKNKKTFTGCPRDDRNLLTKLARDGFPKRYVNDDKVAAKRFEREIEVIDKLGFSPYFLITNDFVQYAKNRGFPHIGRGSGANSLVAYCMGITNVDPISLNLYFERFINPSRTSPPDFDIDFSWDERDEVIDYVFKRYSSNNVALLATYSTFQGRAILRELGKVYGLPPGEIEVLIDGRKHKKQQYDNIGKEIMHYGMQIQGFPNYLSIHAGGVLITEDPICQYSVKQMMPKGFPIVQFDMYTAEDFGFYKYDILAQRGLGHIKDTVHIIRENKGIDIDITQVEKFKNDNKINQQIKRARTIGAFYIESPAMRGLLSKLKCDDFETLVAASSIIRPGVSSSGMMQEFIRRHHDPTSFKYLHPVFEEQLGETYGVMIYQEDVLKIAHHFADLDLSEADILRRGMSGKSRSKKEFQRLKDKFFSNCFKKGYEENLTNEVWRQIESFAGYSFCKAHSASYAVESYQSLFLKTYFPIEFMVGVINNSGGFYKKEVYIHEARMAGAKIEAPCVQQSTFLTSVHETTIFLGFSLIKGLEYNTATIIIRERSLNGSFADLGDFMRRTRIAKEQLILLIRIDALRFTNRTKQELMWAKSKHYISHINASTSPIKFKEKGATNTLPSLDINMKEDIFDQIELLGFTLDSPFNLLITEYRGQIKAIELSDSVGKIVKMVGYFIARKDVRTKHGKLMNFGTWIDNEGTFFDTTHFPQSINKYPFSGPGCYLISGKVVAEFGFPSIEVIKMARLPIINDPRYT